MKCSPLAAVALVLCLLFAVSCKKESLITGPDAVIAISADSLKFDTVFTSVGAVTQSFKIFNTNDQKLRLSSIKLSGGTASAFKMNVNGIAATELDNIDIAANDSIYVFVTVNIDPTVAGLPFLISDSISINYNGNTRFVQLQAYGQNANFIRNGIISTNQIFTNTLPYVIIGSLQVTAAASLVINAGTKIYCHADAPILIDGQLICNGTKLQPVVFAGDRLDTPYVSFPAAWPGIYFRAGSHDNFLQFAQINNANDAIVVQQPSINSNPKLFIKQSIISNSFDAGILCTNTSVTAENCLISNCGKNIHISLGGSYSFTHCTSAGYSNELVLHKYPAAYLSDTDDSIPTLTAPLNALLRNCIFYGDDGFVPDEVSVNKTGSGAFSILMDHCLYRADDDLQNISFNQCIKNQDPLFDSLDFNHTYFDFHITKDPSSPAIDNGVLTALPKDLDDNNRNVGPPDIGCYEKQ